MSPFMRPALLGGALGLLLGAAALLFVPKQFEAIGSIKLGHIDGQPIESSAISAQRLRSYALHDRIVAKLGLTAADAGLFGDSLWVSPRGSEPLLDVRVRAFDRDRARALFEELVASLSTLHLEISAGDLARRAATLRQTQQELETITAARSDIERAAAEARRGKVAERAEEMSRAYALVLSTRDGQLIVLQQTITRLEEALTPTRTFPTAAIDAPNVPERAVFPKTAVFLAAGATLGVAVGFALGAIRRRPVV
jgi:hypothetical protein